MPQAPQNLPAVAGGKSRPLSVSPIDGGLVNAAARGAVTVLNITAAALVKASPGALVKVSVVVAGSTAGAAYDQSTAASPGPATQFLTVPNTAGSVQSPEWPCASGILVVPGAGQTLAVSYS